LLPQGKFGVLPREDPTYVSYDPGLTTGVTLWDDKGNVLHFNEFDIANLHKLLNYLEQSTTRLKRNIVEEWVLYQKKALAQSGSRLEAVQVIGMIKRSNYMMNLAPVVEVRADSKEIAAQWSQTPIPRKGSHMENWKAAYLIGYWWLHYVAKIIPAKVLEQS
jgi:hypothetical protein